MAKDPWETDEREMFRATFDEDPDAYDRARPVAPDEVFDDLVRLARLEPGSTVVEIGPGTGQATRRLAERGLRIVAVELGPGLAARTRQNLAPFPDVDVVTTSFEAWEPGEAGFDAVVACNSFHWIDPDTRFRKAAAALKPDGHLVVLSTPVVVPDGADRFWWEVQDDYMAAGADRVDPESKHPDRIEDLGPAIRASGVFADPTLRRYRFDVTYTADEYAVNLSTQSGMKEFAPERRAALIECIRQRVQSRGGSVTVHLLALLAVARRASVR